MMGRKSFNPAKDIPDLSGKVIFITGGTAGLGKESILALAKHHPEHIYFSGRDSTRAASVINKAKSAALDIKLTFIECDLTSLASVEKAAKQFTFSSQRLDILMCNAGVMAVPPALTKDGYEIHFGTNHVGHALLIKLLLPTLLRTAETSSANVRIVSLTSQGYMGNPKGGILFEKLRTTQEDIGMGGDWRRYAQSKLANILYAAELARRYPNITSVSIHPGVVATDLVGKLSPMQKALVYVTNIGKVQAPADGASNQLWAATADKGDIVNGAYYEPVAVLENLTKNAMDEKLAGKLWEWTQKELEGYQP